VVAARSGRRSCSNHRNRCFFKHRARSDGYPNSERYFKPCSDEEREGGAAAQGRPGDSRLFAASRLRQSPAQRGGQGDRHSYPGHRDREAGPPPYRRTRQIRSLRLTLGLAITAVEDDGSKSTSGAASCCHTGSTVGVTEPSPRTASRVWRGFFPTVSPVTA
jgi:hypothetical protein